MGIGKWICGFLGWITTGSVLGGLAGYFFGKLVFDDSNDSTSGQGRQQQHAYDQQFGNDYAQRQAYEGNRNSFLFSMLVLVSYIIKADGKVMHSEMEAVRRFLRVNFGEVAVKQGESILLRLFEQQNQMGPTLFKATIGQSCAQIRQNMSYEQRLQLFNFLVIVAQADGNVPQSEIEALQYVALGLGISQQDADSMFHPQDASNSLEAAYKTLGVAPTATDDEVKAAFRSMALKHHPDRVATLGEDVRKAAERKFKEINEAKERIYKARGL